MKKLLITFVTTLLFSVTLNAQVGTPGNFEKYEFQPETWQLPEFSGGSVNEHGDYTQAIQLAAISSPGGATFGFTIAYSSDIHYEDAAGWLGLGWRANPGTITRSVRGTAVPDILPSSDYTLSGQCKNINPVDLPTNISSTTPYWDGYKDIYYLTLPNGQSLEMVLDLNSRWNSVHEFEVLNQKGFKVSAKFSEITTVGTGVDMISVGQSTLYGNNGNSYSNEASRDYTAFLIEGPDGIRYLYKEPTLELNVGPFGCQTIYASSWRIVAIFGPWFQGDLWSLPAVSNPNTIVFNYANAENEKMNAFQRELDTEPKFAAVQVSPGVRKNWAALAHLKYLKSVESATGKIEIFYQSDSDVDKSSKIPVQISTYSPGGGEQGVPTISTFILKTIQGRKRIDYIREFRKTKDTTQLYRTVNLDYYSSYSRSFLTNIDMPEYDNNYYSFEYFGLDASFFEDFDYNLIWNYYTRDTGNSYLENIFLNNKSIFSQEVYPWDINGYFRRRSEPGSNNYSNSEYFGAGIGQLNKIIFPSGRVENINYKYHILKDSWEVMDAFSDHTIKQFKLKLYNFNDQGFSMSNFTEGIYDPVNYFSELIYFYKSCPKEIITTDVNSPRTIKKTIQLDAPIFPGTVREQNFNSLANLKKSNNTSFSGTVTDYVNSLPSCGTVNVAKASRSMSIEDKVWFGEISETVNGRIEKRRVALNKKQPLVVSIYNIGIFGMLPQVSISASNYHLVSIGHSKINTSVNDPLWLEEISSEKDYYGKKVKIDPEEGTGNLMPEWDFTNTWAFEKKEYDKTVISDGQIFSKEISFYDSLGNKTITGVKSGKIGNKYQFTVSFQRYAYEESIPGLPGHLRNLPIQVITGIWLVDSLKYSNSETLHKLLISLGKNLRAASGPISVGDSAYKLVFSTFKLTSNQISLYKAFGNGVFGVSDVYVSKDWKWYRFPSWAAGSTPSGDKWQKNYSILNYTSFGSARCIDFGRFREENYFGSKGSQWNANEDSIYWYKITGRKIIGQQLSNSEYKFSAKYDLLCRVYETSSPNKNTYKYYYKDNYKLSKVLRNNVLLKRYSYDLNRSSDTNGLLRFSVTNYFTNVDSIITTDFKDGFGLVQTKSGNSQQIVVKEPLFNRYWEQVGEMVPIYLVSGEQEFQSSFNSTMVTDISNGGFLNVDKYSPNGPGNMNYDYQYKTFKNNSILGSLKFPFVQSYKTGMGSVEINESPGEYKRILSKYITKYHVRIGENNIINFSIDEDNKVDFSLAELGGNVLVEGKIYLDEKELSDTINVLNAIKMISKIWTPTQGMGVETETLPTGGGSGGGGVSGDIPNPSDCIAYENWGKTTLICGSNSTFFPDNQHHQQRAIYSADYVAKPLDLLRIPVSNLPSGKNLNLVTYDLEKGRLDTILVIKGPIVNDTIRIPGLRPGNHYRIDFFTDLGCSLGNGCIEPAYFEITSLMDLKPYSLTYYTYNDLNQLVKVIHPDGSKTEFTYDFAGNVIKKETPFQNAKLKSGVKPESSLSDNPDFEYLYDQYKQLRMSIDPNQSAAGKMSVFLYDSFGRLVETGEMNSAGKWTNANANDYKFPFTTTTSTGSPALDPTDRGGFVAPADYVWKQQFYFDGNDTSEGRIWQHKENLPKPDGTLGIFTKTLTYRKEGWVSKVNTTYPNAVTQEETVYSFDYQGKVLSSGLLLNGALVQRQWNTFSPLGQLTAVYFSSNTTKPGTPSISYNFNRLGQIAGKSFNQINTKSWYGYTEEGWIDTISVYPSLNSNPAKSSRLFKLNYNYYKTSLNPDVAYTKLFNGNIGQIQTFHKDEPNSILESFQYDELDRLVFASGDHIQNGALWEEDIYNSEYHYDVMGNILNLKRNWNSATNPGTAELKDNFVYQYEGSRLRNLVDRSTIAADPVRNLKTTSSQILGQTQYYNTVFPGLSEPFESFTTGSGIPSGDFYSPTPQLIEVGTDPVKGKVILLKLSPAQLTTHFQMDTVQVVTERNYQLLFNYKSAYFFDGEVNQYTRLSASVIWLTASKTVLATSSLLSNGTSGSWLNVTKTVTAPLNAVFAIVKFSATNPSGPATAWIDNVVFEETNLAYTYDGNGNTTQDKVRGISNIVYNSLNLPTQLTYGSGTVNYGYLWSGARWFKKIPGSANVSYYIRGTGGELLGEYTNTPSTVNYLNRYGADLEGKWQKDTGTDYYYIKDHLGNIRQVLKNLSGTPQISSKTDYYPFGAVMRENNTLTPAESKFKYQNKERDIETGYDYFEARMYDSQTIRFLQVDPQNEDYYNSSPYCGMNCDPILNVDPDGKNWFRIAVTAIKIGYRLVTATNGGSVSVGQAVRNEISAIKNDITTVVNGSGKAQLEAVLDLVAGTDLNKAAEPTKTEEDSKDETKPQEETKKETKKERKERVKNEARERKENEPESEQTVKWKAREKEKAEGKDARRKAHDKKDPAGPPERSKKQIKEDYEIIKN